MQKLLENELLGVQIKFERNLNNYVSNKTPQVPLKSVTIESTNETSKPSNYSKDKQLEERIANKSINSEVCNFLSFWDCMLLPISYF